MAIPNLRKKINVYSRTPITPIQEPPSFHYGRGSDRPPPPSFHPAATGPPSTKAVLKATWLNCEDCVQKTKTMIKEIAPVQGIQHLRIDTKKGVIEVEGSIDAHWLRSFLARQFKRNVEVLPDNVKAHSDLQQPPTLPDVNLPNRINKNPNAEAKNRSSPQSPPTQPPNPDSYMVSPMREVVLKTQLHCGCEGCIRKLKTTLLDVKGVQRVKINVEEELIKVQGTMDTKELPACLKKKLKRKVEVIPLKDDKGDQQMSKPKRHTTKTDDSERKHTSRGKLTSFNS